MKQLGNTLDKVVDSLSRLQLLPKASMQFGDCVIVTTRNSIYTIRVLENGQYLVSGGWFDRQGLSPMKTTITGCNWGGSVIKVDILAACGLCLEFGNRVVTTRIQKIEVIRAELRN